ncbi:carbonic anhydrase 4-like [Tachysurus fulvidraco]|uniref:carbonic anhydrase 4-like n=1 Tax=Tachysurus fulvidraco TaxID=1234273 RepID=UPI001FF07C8E|nr:carbonic anhydrase 4-like [Tachysurus fulvidraco]
MRAHITRLVLLASFWTTFTGADWCYQSQVTCEPVCNVSDTWYKLNEDCKKNRQSPINIVTRKTKLDPNLTTFVFRGYQEAFDSLLENNGHSVKVSVPVTHLANVSGGNLGATYKAVQFHLHWGENGGPGSEHTIDGEQYPMELHIVHMREDFKTLDAALKDPTGVAVLGYFYEESKSENKKYKGLIQALKKVVPYKTNTSLTGISLSNLITSEESMTKYYRYDGSLTTPPCSEAVVWTVFEIPIPLSKEQLSAFSFLKYPNGKPMTNNFRPVQPQKNRTVYRSGSAVVMFSFTLLLVCVCSALDLSQLY